MSGIVLLSAAFSAGLPKLEFAEWDAVPVNVEMSVRRDGVTPGREHAREALRRRRRRVEDIRRDEVDYLPENGANGYNSKDEGTY